MTVAITARILGSMSLIHAHLLTPIGAASGGYSPLNTGSRFSLNARMPSR
jgi:hypothetical protein